MLNLFIGMYINACYYGIKIKLYVANYWASAIIVNRRILSNKLINIINAEPSLFVSLLRLNNLTHHHKTFHTYSQRNSEV